jgi:DNA-binding response OmpR family regulator
VSVRILIIDDDEALLAGLADMLKIRLEDVHVATCADPVSAVGMARQDDYDLILCDVCMPRISGLKLLPQLRNERPNAAIIAMSGIADQSLNDAALLSGATAFLAKPFERDVLTTVVKAVLNEADSNSMNVAIPSYERHSLLLRSLSSSDLTIEPNHYT